jgi:hypothetical protein
VILPTDAAYPYGAVEGIYNGMGLVVTAGTVIDTTSDQNGNAKPALWVGTDRFEILTLGLPVTQPDAGLVVLSEAKGAPKK